MSKKRYSPKTMEIMDCNVATFFADDLTAILEHGPVTHLIFSTGKRDASGSSSRNYLEVIVRLIVPNELVPQIARQLLQGECNAGQPEHTDTGEVVTH
jgi:hypothetical protein